MNYFFYERIKSIDTRINLKRYITITRQLKKDAFEMNKWTVILKFWILRSKDYDKSYKIYLALEDIGLEEDEFKILTNFKKVNWYYVLKEFGYYSLEYKRKRASRMLSKKIIENNTDLLMTSAISELSDVLLVERQINRAGKSIDRIYIPSNERIKKELVDSQEFFKKFHRWTGNYPGHDEVKYEESVIRLLRLKTEFEKRKIEVVEI